MDSSVVANFIGNRCYARTNHYHGLKIRPVRSASRWFTFHRLWTFSSRLLLFVPCVSVMAVTHVRTGRIRVIVSSAGVEGLAAVVTDVAGGARWSCRAA